MQATPSVIPIKPITRILDEAVQLAGPKKSMDFLGRSWTYAELASLVDRAAAGFRALGVKPGTRVGLHLPNTPYFIICYFAILKAGGIVVNYNPLYVERELAHQIQDSGTTIMVTMDLIQLYKKVAPLLGKSCLEKLVVCRMADILPVSKKLLFTLFKGRDRIKLSPGPRVIWFESLIQSGVLAQPLPIRPETEIAVLQYTGGTTGVPKGAALTHGSISANVEQICQWTRMFECGDDRMLCVLPFFHVFGMTVAMLLGIARHAELILLPQFEVEKVLKVITKKKPTLLPGVPTIYIALNRALAKHGDKYNLRSIRACISGGAPLPLHVQKEFERHSGCKLVEGYGLSEASPVVTCNPFDRPTPEGSIGLALPGTQIEFRSLEDPHKHAKPGSLGEICILGPQVMAGYWQKPEATRDAFVDGALRTGDVGYADDKGFIYIVDRLKDLIICSGYNVYPYAIEKAIYLHPAVSEVAVIGVPDSYRGQTPKAYVHLKQGAELSQEELKLFLEDHLSPLEMPQTIIFRGALPRTAIGKFSKKTLLEEAMAAQ